MISIKGTPMKKITGIEMNPVYRSAYRACINAGKNRTKATVTEYDKLINEGLDNPAKTKILIKTARKDYLSDIKALSGGDFTQILSRHFNTLKTNLELKFNSTYRRSQNALNNALKEQHPKSYRLRNKVLEKSDTAFKNETKPFARLGRLNINPMNL